MENLTIRELIIQLITQISSRNEDYIIRISEVLKKRTGKKYARDIDKWIKWYLKGQANETDKNIVKDRYELFLKEL